MKLSLTIASVLASTLAISLMSPVAGASVLDFFSSDRTIKIDLPIFNHPAASLYVPKSDHGAPRPLVILLHGYSSTAEKTTAYLGLRRLVGERDFLLLTPDGMRDANDYQYWNATDFCCDNHHRNNDDVGYLNALIDETLAIQAVDRSRIYLVGHSNGAFMANRLVCERPNFFAGVVSFAGGTYRSASDCKHPAPTSYLQIHSIDDRTVAFEGGTLYAGGSETLHRYLAVDKCTTVEPTEETLDLISTIPGPDTTATSWQCADRNVGLWLIKQNLFKPGQGHKPKLTSKFASLILDWLWLQQLK